MADIISKEKRSWIMSRVRAKNTKPEMIVRSMLHRNGFRFRLHRDDLPGKPDIVLPKYKKVIFVHGCFWHQHTGCKKAKRPKENREFWDEKLNKNIARDNAVQLELKELGWNFLIIWECEVKKKLVNNLAKKVDYFLSSKSCEE